jgi:hypothetical protein
MRDRSDRGDDRELPDVEERLPAATRAFGLVVYLGSLAVGSGAILMAYRLMERLETGAWNFRRIGEVPLSALLIAGGLAAMATGALIVGLHPAKAAPIGPPPNTGD